MWLQLGALPTDLGLLLLDTILLVVPILTVAYFGLRAKLERKSIFAVLGPAIRSPGVILLGLFWICVLFTTIFLHLFGKEPQKAEVGRTGGMREVTGAASDGA